MESFRRIRAAGACGVFYSEVSGEWLVVSGEW